MIDEDALLASFVDESQQHLQTIEPDLLELEKIGIKWIRRFLNRISEVFTVSREPRLFRAAEDRGTEPCDGKSPLASRDRKIAVTRELTDACSRGWTPSGRWWTMWRAANVLI